MACFGETAAGIESRELFSGLNCWLNSVTSFCCFVLRYIVYIPPQFLFCIFVPLNLIRRAELPTSIAPRVVCMVTAKKAAKPRVRKRKQIQSIFFFILSFNSRSFVSGIIICWWTVASWFFFLTFLCVLLPNFFHEREIFVFRGSIASCARARWPLRPRSYSSDLQDERGHRDWSRADGQSSRLLWVPHMWAQFS